MIFSRWRRSAHGSSALGTEADRATFRTLHTAALAAPALREGLNRSSAERAIRHLRDLLATPAAALTDTVGLLAWDGVGSHHADLSVTLARRVLEHGDTQAFGPGDLACEDPGCALRSAVISPLILEDRYDEERGAGRRAVGTLQLFAAQPTAGLVRAADEVATWVSGQLQLAELTISKTRLIEAEMRALRAQISPHFIYNSLGAIASFVRTDPDRARHLLLEFADFTRYSFRQHGEFTTLAEELRSIEQYLLLEQARFGDRLRVTLQIAPEVLPVTIPCLCLQPLVENAVRHGLESRDVGGTISIIARNLDRDCQITIEDDGVGEDPELVRRALAGDRGLESVGLGNVDARLRHTFGDDCGLVVETAPGAGTKVHVRVPKYAVGVHADPPGPTGPVVSR
ncbi:MAG: sensor histidine kinase [Nocardioides sp.]